MNDGLNRLNGASGLSSGEAGGGDGRWRSSKPGLRLSISLTTDATTTDRRQTGFDASKMARPR